MRRTLAVLALSGLAATVVGSAASLSLSSTGNAALQTGTITATCDVDGIDANWGLETDTDTVQNVRLSQIDAACAGAKVFVRVLGENDAVLYASPNNVVIAGTTHNVPFAPLATEDIEGLTVWIQG